MRLEGEKRFPEWQSEYEAALLETDPQKLSELIHKAEAAIFNRLQALNTGSDGHIEHAALSDAAETLRRLQIEILGYPDWENSVERGSGCKDLRGRRSVQA